MKKLKNKSAPIKLQFCLQKATSHHDHLPLRKEFIHWIKCVLQAVPASAYHNHGRLEITVRLVDEEESAYLNQQYRHKTGPTNVLSFPSASLIGDLPPGGIVSDPTLENQFYYLGDLVVCVPLVFQEAVQQDKSNLAHWAHLTIHGVLHLMGYDHIDENEAVVMEALEVNILKELGHENPYIHS